MFGAHRLGHLFDGAIEVPLHFGSALVIFRADFGKVPIPAIDDGIKGRAVLEPLFILISEDGYEDHGPPQALCRPRSSDLEYEDDEWLKDRSAFNTVVDR